MILNQRISLIIILLVLVGLVLGHEHMEEGSYNPEFNFRNDEPIDKILKFHIILQTLSWGLLFPFGINKSKYHVPFQSITIILTLVGNYLAHHHRGREFHETAHSNFSKYLFWYLILQTTCGIFLKSHLLQRSSMRKVVVSLHGFIGKTFPVVGWSQIVLGSIASLGFCFGEHTGQCLAHFIMGSSFIGYGLFLLMMLKIGAPCLAKRGWSQELIDSSVITFFGVITTFTMHNFLGGNDHWNHKDMQHTSMGIMWWTLGSLGIYLGRNGKRNIIPSIIIVVTGWAMSSHAQSLEFSTKIHQVFGVALMGAGVSRLIEICFVVQDSSSSLSKATQAFQHLPPYLLVLSGLTFLSSTEEQVEWMSGEGIDHVTYTNLLFSGSALIYLLGVVLLGFYKFTKSDEGKEEERNENSKLEEGRSWISSLPLFRNRRTRESASFDTYSVLPLIESRNGTNSEGSNSSSNGSSNNNFEDTREVRMSENIVFDTGEIDEGEDTYWMEK